MADRPPSYAEAQRMPASGGRVYERYVPEDASRSVRRACEHAECPVCYEEMWREQSGVFADLSGRRTCPHFFHLRCAQQLREQSRGGKHCPLCRASFESVVPVPEVEGNPEDWFNVVDVNGDRSLSQAEIRAVLLAQLRVDPVMLDEQLGKYFREWDLDRNKLITKDEFLHPSRGLLVFVKEKVRRQKDEVIPDIRNDKHAWFEHFDEDKTGSLEFEEVVRGLTKTFGMSANIEKIDALRENLRVIWAVFDDDGNLSIDKAEFLRPSDGLADTIVATLMHT